VEDSPSSCSQGGKDRLLFSSVVKPAVDPIPPTLLDGSDGHDGTKRVGNHKAGEGGAGDEAEDCSDAAQDPSAYWQELPPGLYSLAMKHKPPSGRPLRQSSSAGQREHGEGQEGRSCPGADVSGEGQQRNSPLGLLNSRRHHPALDLDRRLPWGLAGVKSHAWADALIQRVSEYSRPGHSQGESAWGGRGGDSGSRRSLPPSECGGSGPAPACPLAGGAKSCASNRRDPDERGGPLLPLNSDLVLGESSMVSIARDEASVTNRISRPIGTAWSPDSAVEAVLAALQHAVDVSANVSWKFCVGLLINICTPIHLTMP